MVAIAWCGCTRRGNLNVQGCLVDMMRKQRADKVPMIELIMRVQETTYHVKEQAVGRRGSLLRKMVPSFIGEPEEEMGT